MHLSHLCSSNKTSLSYKPIIFLIIFFLTLNNSVLPTSHADDLTIRRGVVFHGIIEDAAADQLKAWNVNLVRYTLIWGNPSALDASNEASYLAWLNAALDEFDVTLGKLQARGIKVALNLHSPPGGFSSRGSKASHRLFENASFQSTYVKTWQIIASRYNGNSTIWAYDILNEPAQTKKLPSGVLSWNDLAQQTAEIIRAIDPTTPIIMTPIYGKLTRFAGMKKLTVPNVYYTIHFYDPWKFIHQGVLGVPLGATYPSKLGNLSKFTRSLRPLQNFARKNKSRMYIGEFSVARWAPKGSGARYLKDITNIFKRYRFDWTYHSYRGATIWNLEMSDKKSVSTYSTTDSSRLKVMLKAWSSNTP
jgi:endoglucanase